MTVSNSQRRVPQQNWAHTIRGVAFDLDGLMVNTEDLYTIVGQTLLSRRNREFGNQLKNAMMGLPGPKAYQVMIEREQLEDTPEQLAEEAEVIFAELLPQRVQPLEGLVPLLDELQRLGLPRCVATSSKRLFAEQVLELIEVAEFFDFVITAEEVPHGKPSPDIYLAAAAQLGIGTEEMLVLEDSHHGSRAGVAAGACTVAVPGEHSQDHDFSGVHAVASTLRDPLIYQILSHELGKWADHA